MLSPFHDLVRHITTPGRLVRRALALATVLALAALPMAAQTSTANVRGYVRSGDGAPVGNAQVSARNLDNNAMRGAISNASGFYFIGGLVPGRYEVTLRRIGLQPQTRSVVLPVGATIDLDLSATEATVQLAAVQVQASANAETRSTEVATNVSEAQINDLPTASRNILDLATLAPGTRVQPDRAEGTGRTFAAGAQAANQVNVFVDGASYKNDIITGGVVGQDASRGNPFPRNSVQEFRIITNNFRAEYQKASSAIITAVTKSGTNTWQGNAFLDAQNEGFVALDTFARVRNAQKTDYSRYLGGISAGGPLVKDRLFFFGGYEINRQNREGRTLFGGDSVRFPAGVRAFNNTINVSPFRQHLGFGKVTWVPDERNTLEFSQDIRRESDIRGFGGQFGEAITAYSASNDQRNNVYTSRVKHTRSGGSWTNEALASYQMFQWNQEPIDFSTPQRVAYGQFRVGGSDGRQDLKQNRVSLRNDWTYSGLQVAGDHIVKIGANYDFTRYDMNKQNNENPTFEFNSGDNFTTPTGVIYGFGNGVIKQTNNQFGIYAQDTWNPTRRLSVDLGLRWDVETGMFNRDYVTPQGVRDSVGALIPNLPVRIDPERYFSDGDDRGLFLGAWQPRVGASYQLTESGNTAVFASWGIFYDRLEFNATLDETYRRQHPRYFIPFNNDRPFQQSYYTREGLNSIITGVNPPTQEVFLIPNDLRPPKANQFSAGVRQAFLGFNGTFTYNITRSFDGFSFEWANLTYNPATNDCCVSVATPGYQNILVGNNDVRTWYDAFLVQLDRPYRRFGPGWGYGVGLAYTLSRAEAEGNDLFSFPQVRAYGNTRHPIGDDRRHQIVANWVADVPYLWGIQFSGIAQVSSGTSQNNVQFVPQTNGPVQRAFVGRNRNPWFHNVDVRLRKDFVNIGGNRAGVTGSLFNAFNHTNLSCFGDVSLEPNYDTPNATDTRVPGNYRKASCLASDPRRFQLGLTYDF
jgi:hypothetical protein